MSPEARAEADRALDAALDRWIAADPGAEALMEHRIDALVARRLRDTGRPVPGDLADEEEHARLIAATAPEVLRRLRAAVDGPVLLLKGLEVAATYPVPETRCGFGDIDVVVPDAPAAQRRLLAAGFAPVGDPADYAGIHHLQPLEWPGLPLLVEVHHRPKWPAGGRPPALAELLAEARPARAGVEGVLAPSAEHHAVLIAAHGWAGGPLGRLRDLIDVARMALEADPHALEATARRWGAGGIWRTSAAAAGWALSPAGRPPAAVRLWARHLGCARDPRVAEVALRRWTSPFWERPPRAALAASGRAVAADLRPRPGETWAGKARRTARTVADLRASQLDHDHRELGGAGEAGRV